MKCIMLHGLRENAKDTCYFDTLGDILSKNYDVKKLTLRQHEINGFYKIENSPNFSKTLKDIYKVSNGEDIGLIGGSYGGYIACLYAMKHDNLNFLITINAPRNLLEVMKPSSIINYLSNHKNLTNYLVKLFKKVPRFKLGHLVIDKNSIELIGEIIKGNTPYINQSKIKCPALYLQGTEDKTVPPNARLEKIELFKADHPITFGYDILVKKITKFLDLLQESKI